MNDNTRKGKHVAMYTCFALRCRRYSLSNDMICALRKCLRTVRDRMSSQHQAIQLGTVHYTARHKAQNHTHLRSAANRTRRSNACPEAPNPVSPSLMLSFCNSSKADWNSTGEIGVGAQT
jgi:hypothetical protein